jgi:hypothetical protein
MPATLRSDRASRYTAPCSGYHFSLTKNVFTIRDLDDSDEALLGAITEITEARLFEFARRRSSSEIIGRVMPEGRRLCLMLDERPARRVGNDGEWVRLEVAGNVFHGLVRKVAINRIGRRADDPHNIATEVLTRAADAATPADAMRRALRLVPTDGGGFSLEFFGSTTDASEAGGNSS